MKKPRTASQVALRLHYQLKLHGPRRLPIFRGLVRHWVGARRAQAMFEQAIGILFLRGLARWIGKKSGRRIAPA